MKISKTFFLFGFFAAFLSISEPIAAAQDDGTVQSQTIEAAKRESKVYVYGPSTGRLQTTPEGKRFISRFQKKYPFLEVEFVRVSAIRLMERIATEYKARQYLADVVTTSAGNYYPLMKLGLVGKYLSPEAGAIPNNLKDKEAYWASCFVAVFTMAYNTNLVSMKDIPKSSRELLDPKWKGRKIGIDEDNSLRWFIAQSEREGKDKAMDYLRRLASQDPFVTSGGSTLLIQLLAAGEFAVVHTTTTHSVQTAKQLGAPIEWVKTPEPLPTIPVVIGIAARPPHPNAAKLYINFTLSEEGQKLLSPVFQIPARDGIDTEPAGLLKGLNLYPVRPETFENFNEDQTKFRNLFLRTSG
jgi:ABC-type Fe3+ transport system substrate-binding protein